MKAVCMFVRNPVLGQVKTRLAALLGDEKALDLYKRILLQQVKEHSGAEYDFFVAYAPGDALENVQDFLGSGEYFAQSAGDLGVKMRHALSKLLEQYSAAIVIGSDIPDITREIIEGGFAYLNEKDIVIGPCFDGGYYLIGMSTAHDVFSGIAWGGASVLSDTEKKCKALGLSVGALAKLYDVDTIHDLEKIKKPLY